jgi:nucleoside-diphosphate-sugar epimerase
MLIVGATGIVGDAALTHFCRAPDWDVIAVSRRAPDPRTRGEFRHVAIDLTDGEATRRACQTLSAVTHLLYAAVSEGPGLVTGWHDRDRMQLNLTMLSNLMDPLCAIANGLRHVTILQGAKAYGAHAGHPPPVPARERDPRVEHENFYWLQEDYLRRAAADHDFAWTIFRPQVVIGGAWGSAMNPLLLLAVYAALRRDAGEPFGYPGGAMQISEIVDASLLAEACEWASATDAARNETFNITNGDVFAWRDSWPMLADALGVEVGLDRPTRLADYLPARHGKWRGIVARKNLRPLTLAELLGESHYYADILLRMDADVITRPTLLSTIKLRQADFSGCRDSEDVIRGWITELQDRRRIPR